ncbi:MAG TPA: M14-type cytosolic carboxypeptidase [Noviherbaspirillum sp.]
MSIKISHQFDAGAIEVVDAASAADIRLRLRKDSHADFSQWFYFRLQGARETACRMRILNAGEASYPDGWVGYQAVASYDRQSWFRVPTTYENGVLEISHRPERDSIYYAYFEPYSFERHLNLIGRVACHDSVRVEGLGNTVDGRNLNLLVVGNADAASKVWIIARQHPGETMAEWFVEGLLDALLDAGNPHSRALLSQAVFYVVPNMNPDGAARGNLRTNAAGANLNREWVSPSLETSPEVFHVRERLHQTGCDLFLDVHGDEGLPYVFAAGSEMLEGFTAEQAAAQQTFIDAFKEASPDFQDQHGYPSGKYRADLLKLASKYVGHHFKCVSLTLELPFKDNTQRPDPTVGWNGARSAQLGAACLKPIGRSLNIASPA